MAVADKKLNADWLLDHDDVGMVAKTTQLCFVSLHPTPPVVQMVAELLPCIPSLEGLHTSIAESYIYSLNT